MKTVILFAVMLISISACNKCYKCEDGSEHCKPSDMTNKEWKEFNEKFQRTDTDGNVIECH